ncbi:expressed unknown protein [Seminavis robusta]|uniref:Uncharacterized protein n=1 Tax=Seminavis robusta TaxID=568900 RepID=A0A9N8DYY6_9STRA|nr:expressed unknown protein [Seminavis robusta]|eukprot:Sro487_g152860.1 n/a (204) ;mRNA; r:28375-28986
MVFAALIRAILHGNCCCCSSKYKIVTLDPFYEPEDKDKRRERRREELNIWLTSTADDLDLVADWWFFIDTYNNSGLESLGQDPLILALFIFSCLGSFTWLLELVNLASVRRTDWVWLPVAILVLEDIPQVVLTLFLQTRQNRFDNISNLGLFNVMTSLYSLSIRLASEVFLNSCYGCERMEPDETATGDDDEDIEKVVYWKKP